MSASPDDFVALQREHSAVADPTHFWWQTEGPGFAAGEAALVEPAVATLPPNGRLLELGCGEGGNLWHLQRSRPDARLVGLDFSRKKATHAGHHTAARALAADAAHLPFADASFDAVLIRDLLHHVPDRARVLAEARRVVKPGGALTLIEPNGRSPLGLLQALTIKAERGILASTAARLRDEVARAGFRIARTESLQPFPVERVVLNPAFGRPSLGAHPAVALTLGAVERVSRALVPSGLWLYLRIQAVA